MRRAFIVLVSMVCHAWIRASDGLRRRMGGGEPHPCIVLYYHGVTDRQAAAFRRQMQWLASHAAVGPLAETIEPGVANRVCITFDDAFDNLRRNVLPVLREYGLPATIFAVSRNLGRTPQWRMDRGDADAGEAVVSEAALREIAADPLFEIGSHTQTHSHASSLGDAELHRELAGSKADLEAILGRPVESLSLPYGDCPDWAARTARDAGYERMVTCARIATGAGEDPMRIGRFKVTPDDWPMEFRLKAKGAYGWIGRVRGERSGSVVRRLHFSEASGSPRQSQRGAPAENRKIA